MPGKHYVSTCYTMLYFKSYTYVTKQNRVKHSEPDISVLVEPHPHHVALSISLNTADLFCVTFNSKCLKSCLWCYITSQQTFNAEEMEIIRVASRCKPCWNSRWKAGKSRWKVGGRVGAGGKDPNLRQFFYLLRAALGAYYLVKPARVLLWGIVAGTCQSQAGKHAACKHV